jgi:protocatechuate 3,4-dioxygenase beta subunit
VGQEKRALRVKRTSRRDALKIFHAAGATALIGCGGNSSVDPRDIESRGGGSGGTAGSGAGTSGTSGEGGVGGSDSCIVRPAQTPGPYFVDELLIRSDIRSDPTTGEIKEGVPLRVIFRVSELFDGECSPLVDAMVDLWQCDALGVYGDVLDGGGQFDTRGLKFLRGLQATDANGKAEFTTIYPGWYTGRTVHLHFKVRTVSPASDFTSQLYFDDAVTDEVMRLDPYASRGARSTLNSMDSIFLVNGADLVLNVEREGDGYVAEFELGVVL